MCIIERERVWEREKDFFFTKSKLLANISTNSRHYSNFFSVHQSKWKIRQQFALQLNFVHTLRVIALWMQFILQELAAICTVLVCPMNQKKESINTAPVLCVINEYRVLYSEFTLSVSFSGVGQCFLCSNVSEIKDTLQFYIIFKYIVNLYMLIIFNYVSNLVKT